MDTTKKQAQINRIKRMQEMVSKKRENWTEEEARVFHEVKEQLIQE